MPQRLSIYVELLIGNENEAFLKTWHENLLFFSPTLMSRVITFSDDQTTSKVNEKIKKTKNYMQNLIETNVKRLFLYLKRMMNSTENA